MAFSIYVHVPFCLSKCHYCAFFSEPIGVDPIRTSSLESRTSYLDGLALEIELRQKDALPGASSLFIGGGTPTLLNEDELTRLMKLLRQGFALEPSAEFSVEGNPGTITGEKLRALMDAGVNRFSLGVQSFNDQLLRRIGRSHTADQARQGIESVRRAGIRNLNLDLIFGLPGQTMEDWQTSVGEALGHQPEHFSLYALTLEEGTVLARQEAKGLLGGEARLPDEDALADMYAWAVERLAAAGYGHYETSNFALPGYECRHNQNYWRGGDYLGLGPGAVSCRDGVRRRNIENIARYRSMLGKEREPVSEQEVLSLRQRMAERLILGLRTADGVDLAMFQADFGRPVEDVFGPDLAKHVRSGALSRTNGYLRLDKRYAFVANAILRDFV